jgi:apolipoprotein N-acyltransferase
MRLGWPGWAQAGLVFGLGAVVASGQVPLGFWWLALAGLAALTAAIARARDTAAAFWLGLLAGGGHFALALSWLVQPFLIDAETHAWMAPFAVLFMSFGLALFWAAAAAVSSRMTGWRRPLALALALTLAELGRAHLFTGFPWATIGHIFIGTPVSQLASLGGAVALTLVATGAAALPVAFGRRGLAAAALLVSASAAFGQWRLDQPDPVSRPLMLRLAQPNAEQGAKWDPVQARAYFDRLLDFTAASPRPDLVIWPETAVPYMLEYEPELAPMIAAAAQGVPVVTGIQRTDGTRYFNSLVVIGPDAQVQARYDKHHLVPFGEYIPFGDTAHALFGISAFAARQGNGYAAGTGPSILDLGPQIGRVLPLICYEAIFPQDVLNAPGRADWILQITNDAWFGTLTGPFQHLAQARLRAIEQGLPLVRVANTGVSAVVDAKGRVLSTIPLGEAAFLDAPLPPALAPTPYARWGDGPVLGLLAALIAAVGLAAGRKRA